MSEEPANTLKDFRVATDPLLGHTQPEEPSQHVPAIDPATRPEFENLGELPARYNQMFSIARDPHWLFTYWDFDYAQFPATRQLALQVFCEGQLETTVDINEIARNWYIPVQRADASYRVIFGYRDSAGAWHQVGEAGPTRTPPESVSSDWNSQFATVPFHLSFNLLLDVIAAANASGEPLTKALGDLERASLKMPGTSSDYQIDQLKILEALLGKDLLERLFSLSSGVLGSSEVTQFLRRELETKLDSGAASELLARGRLAEMLAPGETSLFSGVLKAAITSELSSAGVTSFGAETSSAGVTSFGAETSSAGVTSFGAEVSSFGSVSESLSSWQTEVSPLLAGAESSGALGSAAVSSFGESFSSLELASLASSESLLSWQAALAGGGASEFLSLSSETLSSGGFSSESQALWSGLESNLSSWSELSSESSLFSGLGASWSGQPFSQPERGFFMHVNAEVIFYGGTDPRAKVYIAGQPVELYPDGTFRYHFKLPDQEFEIPIVAVSPDNVEARTAILSLRRATERRGDVGATAQPGHLTAPMGAK
jgi:hypothetical protein